MSKVQKWIELKPLGVGISQITNRPELLLKNEEKDLIIPILISPLDAGVMIQQSGRSKSLSSPYLVTERILKEVGWTLKKCYLTGIDSSGQVLSRLEFTSPKKNIDNIKADQSLPLSIYLGVKIYATTETIWKIKASNQGQNDHMQEYHILNSVSDRGHTYLM